MDIATGYTALSTAYQMAKGLKDIDDRVKLNAAVIELQEKILSAQEAAHATRLALDEMHEKLAAFERWEATAARYELKNLGGNTFAYQLKPVAAEGEPIHRCCPRCFEERKRSILQFQYRSQNGQETYICPSCRTKFDFGQMQQTGRRSYQSDQW